MKIMFTELTRPRSASGVESWIAVLPQHDADLVGHARDHVRGDREREGTREPEHDRREAVDADRDEQRPARRREPAGAASSATADIASAPSSSDDESTP